VVAVSSRSRSVSGRTAWRSKATAGRAGAGGLPAPGSLPASTSRGVPGRERVTELQRARMLTAMTELVRERGVSGVMVAHVVGRSGVSRRTFYEQFEDREGCLLAAFEHAVELAAATVLPAYRAADDAGGAWEERIRAGLQALLGFLDADPALGGLCVVDVLAGERPVLERRARVVGVLIDAVHRGGASAEGAGRGRGSGAVAPGARSPGARAGATGATRGAPQGVTTRASANGGLSPVAAPGRPPRIVAEGAVGAVLAVVHARLCVPSPRPLSGLLNQLMGMLVLPYLGPEAAARELERPVPRARRRPAARPDPLRALDMRLTYRTVRVLLAISELGGPGSMGGRAEGGPAEGGRAPNSREVADAAGVSDQGQISKLLWRLADLGLIANGAPTHGRGEPCAWMLTPKGREVERAIRVQTGGEDGGKEGLGE
jgi:AcrR family transcriptional regulator